MPGNLRELENLLERTFLFPRGPLIEDFDVPGGAWDAATGEPADADFRELRRRAGRAVEATR